MSGFELLEGTADEPRHELGNAWATFQQQRLPQRPVMPTLWADADDEMLHSLKAVADPEPARQPDASTVGWLPGDCPRAD